MVVRIESGGRLGYSALGITEVTGFPTPEVSSGTRQPKKAWALHRQFTVTLAVYVFVMLIKRIKIHEMKQTPTEELVDAASVLFPHLSNSSVRSLKSPYVVTDRPDIKSFMFDLGGSTCACTLQWDKHQYWQRLWYGQKYVVGHVMTAFGGPLFVPCWEWVLLYKFANEFLEEVVMPINGKWAGTVKPMGIEPRYDSLVNDVFLCGLLFVLLSFHLVYVIDLPYMFEEKLQYDICSCYRLLNLLFQFYTYQKIIPPWEAFGFHAVRFDVLGLSVFTGPVWAFTMQIVYLRLFWSMQAWPLDRFWKVSLCLFLLWSPFTFFKSRENYNEQIEAALSFSLTGFAISGYQYVYTSKKTSIMLFASVWYVGAFVFYISMKGVNPFISPPVDKLYSSDKVCGISESLMSDSCFAINKMN